MVDFYKAESNHFTEKPVQSLNDAEDELMKDPDTLCDIACEQFQQEKYDYFYEAVAACRKGDNALAGHYFNLMVNTAIDKELEHD